MEPKKNKKPLLHAFRVKKFEYFATLLIFIFTSSGCALTTRRPLLTYNPVLPMQPENNIAIRVVSFKDERKIKDTTGYVRNIYGMRMGKVVPQNDVIEWITDSLKSELKNAGYTVSDEKNVPNIIEGSVFDILCDVYFTYDGRIALKVILKRDQKVALEKDYSIKKNCGPSMVGTTKAFGKTLEMILQEAFKQVIVDIDRELLK